MIHRRTNHLSTTRSGRNADVIAIYTQARQFKAEPATAVHMGACAPRACVVSGGAGLQGFMLRLAAVPDTAVSASAIFAQQQQQQQASQVDAVAEELMNLSLSSDEGDSQPQHESVKDIAMVDPAPPSATAQPISASTAASTSSSSSAAVGHAPLGIVSVARQACWTSRDPASPRNAMSQLNDALAAYERAAAEQEQAARKV